MYIFYIEKILDDQTQNSFISGLHFGFEPLKMDVFKDYSMRQEKISSTVGKSIRRNNLKFVIDGDRATYQKDNAPEFYKLVKYLIEQPPLEIKRGNNNLHQQ